MYKAWDETVARSESAREAVQSGVNPCTRGSGCCRATLTTLLKAPPVTGWLPHLLRCPTPGSTTEGCCREPVLQQDRHKSWRASCVLPAAGKRPRAHMQVLR